MYIWRNTEEEGLTGKSPYITPPLKAQCLGAQISSWWNGQPEWENEDGREWCKCKGNLKS